MKTFRFFMVATLLGVFGSSFAQSTTAASKSSTYFVQVPHTQEQCMNMLNDMKGKGDKLLSKFEFGCMSGDHTGYAFLEGTSENDVRQMLPTAEQKAAKVTKVNKMSSAEIEKLHKEHM